MPGDEQIVDICTGKLKKKSQPNSDWSGVKCLGIAWAAFWAEGKAPLFGTTTSCSKVENNKH